MARYEFLQPKFTEGVLARAFHGRSSEEFYHYGLKSCKNMIPTLSGPCVKRPGTNFIGEARSATSTFHPFFKDKDNTYILEIGSKPPLILSVTWAGMCDSTLTVNTHAGQPAATSAADIKVGDIVTGQGIPSFPVTTVASKTNTTITITNVTETSGTNVLLTFEKPNAAYLRIWSQNRLLKARHKIPYLVSPNPAASSTSLVATVVTSTNVITTSAVHGLADANPNAIVRFTTTGTLPAGLAVDTDYYVLTTPSTTTLTVSVANEGSIVNITTTGSGVHSLHINRWQINQSATSVQQTSTSGSGINTWFSITTDVDGEPTVTVTSDNNTGYLVGDTIVITDPGNTSNTATVTVSDVPYTFEVLGLPWTDSQVKTITTTQSGDNIFVCTPSRKPYRIIRTLNTYGQGADICEDGSLWAVEEFVMEDGPWNDINIYKEDDAESQYTLKLKTEPSPAVTAQNKIIANVEFDVTSNSVALMNHGLQTGMKVRLAAEGPSGTIVSIQESDTGTYLFATTAAHGLIVNDIIQIQRDTLPNNMSANTDYFVKNAAPDADSGPNPAHRFSLSKEKDGAGNITYSASHGSGTVTGGIATFSSTWGNLVNSNDANATNTLNGIKDVYVVASVSGFFKVSDLDTGSPYELKLRTGTLSPSVNVLLSRPRYKAGTDVIFEQFKTGVAYGSPIKTSDIGRLIRINPLSRPLEAIGGIRWAWGIIKAKAFDEITVTLKTEICNTRENTEAEVPTKGTSEFRLGAFSDLFGWPKVAQIYQQRMVFAATTTQPSTIWLSKTADFYSFAPTEIANQDIASSVKDGLASEIITDANGLNFTLDSDTLDEIKWLAESKKLTMGTSAGIYMLYGTETNLTVTPYRFTINKESTFSATNIPPIVVSNTVIYPQIGGKDVQALIFEGDQEQWFSSKISLKGYDIIRSSEIKKMVWQERPNNIIWLMMDDGRLLSLSYDRQTNFQAWSEHIIGGTNVKVTDINILPIASHDQLWLQVERTINGSTKYYIETLGRFPKEGSLARDAYVFSDSALTKSIAGKTFTVTSSSGLLVTCVAHGLIDTQIIEVTNSGGALPNTLATGTNYYVKLVNADTFRLALTSGGTSIAYHAGSGTHSWRTKVINSHTHLVGETVQIYYGGMQHINKVVASNGTVSLDHFQATDTVVGLPYEGELETLEPSAPDNQYSYSKRLLNLQLLIEDSLGIKVEYNSLSEEILFRSMLNQMGVKIDLFSGKKDLSLSGIGWETHNLKIISNGPFPMQINSLVIEAETGGT